MKSFMSSCWVAVLLFVSLVSAAEAQSAKKYVVTFKSLNGVPANLEAKLKQQGATLYRALPQIGAAIASSSNPDFAASFAKDPSVDAVSPDQRFQLRDTGSEEEPIALPLSSRATAKAAGFTRSTAQVTVDPTAAEFYSLQWNFPLIQADEAWARGHFGDSNIVVAVVESGIDYTHPELAGKVDLSRSVSFVPADDALVAALFPGAHPIVDLNLGGTFVAGIIACNAVGSACIAPNVTLVGVKTVDTNSFGEDSAHLSGLVYSADIGADIIAMTFAGHVHPRDPGGKATLNAYKRAVNYAHQKGSVVIAGIGELPLGVGFDADAVFNDVQFPPAHFTGAIGVSSTAPTRQVDFDGLTPYSNFGATLVDIAAPGGRLFASQRDRLIGPCSSFSLRFPTCLRDDPSDPYNHVLWASGNFSMAHVAGVAALIDSAAGGKLKHGTLKARLFQATDDIGEPGKDKLFGHGRINVLKAVEAIEGQQ
jgi:lantibiotic leader peptide-processing serine protease